MAASDRIYWQAGRDAELQAGFRQQWQQLRGNEPQLLDHPVDAALSVQSYGRDAQQAPGNHNLPTVWLGLPHRMAEAGAKEAGIYAEAPVAAVFDLWQKLLPQRQPGGLLVGATGRARWPFWQRLAKQRQLPLQPGFIRAGEQPQRVFNLLRPGINVLLYSAELATDEPVAISVILRESLSSGLPVLGTDPSLLPAGALAVVHLAAHARGEQAARLAVGLLRGESPGWQAPQGLATLINYQVARTLQLPIEEPAAGEGSGDPTRTTTNAERTEEQP